MVGSSRDWLDFIGSLKRQGVKFVIVGAHALAALGKPRHTGDLDVFVDPAPANVEKVARALRDFGLDSAADASYRLAEPHKMMVLGREPVRIDITNTLSGITFNEAWEGHDTHQIGDHAVEFLGRREFVKNKHASSENVSRRAKDLADLALLGEIPPQRKARRRRRPR
jgi:hypothetical protein